MGAWGPLRVRKPRGQSTDTGERTRYRSRFFGPGSTLISALETLGGEGGGGSGLASWLSPPQGIPSLSLSTHYPVSLRLPVHKGRKMPIKVYFINIFYSHIKEKSLEAYERPCQAVCLLHRFLGEVNYHGDEQKCVKKPSRVSQRFTSHSIPHRGTRREGTTPYTQERGNKSTV